MYAGVWEVRRMNSTRLASKQGMQGQHSKHGWVFTLSSLRTLPEALATGSSPRAPLPLCELGARDFHCPTEGDWDPYTYTYIYTYTRTRPPHRRSLSLLLRDAMNT